MFPPVKVFVPVFVEPNNTSDDKVIKIRTPSAPLLAYNTLRELGLKVHRQSEFTVIVSARK